MGTFHVNCVVKGMHGPSRGIRVRRLLVDSGPMLTWIPSRSLRSAGVRVTKKDIAFRMANCQSVRRSIGYAFLRVEGFETVDEVVFAEQGDLSLLGARTLEGFHASVDPRRKRLVASGPDLAAP